MSAPARRLGAFAALRALTAEAVRDALRRRLAFAIALVLGLGVLGAESCTDLAAVDLALNEQRLDGALVAGFVAPALLSLQALAVLGIAALLASDHLARPLADGSAALWLARPVSRGVWAGARLAGALAVAFAALAILLGASGALLVTRHGLAPGPALAAAAATALGAVVVAALTATALLFVGRTGVLLLAGSAIPAQLLANGLAIASEIVQRDAAPGGLLGAIDRLGPPLGAALFAALAPWNPHVDASAALASALVRLAAWAIGAVALLVLAFRRREIAA